MVVYSTDPLCGSRHPKVLPHLGVVFWDHAAGLGLLDAGPCFNNLHASASTWAR